MALNFFPTKYQVNDLPTFSYSYFLYNIACYFSGLKEFLNDTTLLECQDLALAYKTLNMFDNLLINNSEPWLKVCPVPCQQTVYSLNLINYHRTNIPHLEFDQISNTTVLLTMIYNDFIIEREMETLIYDTGTFFTQVGGNLGLFLGFSCFSLLIGTIDLMKMLCTKFQKT